MRVRCSTTCSPGFWFLSKDIARFVCRDSSGNSLELILKIIFCHFAGILEQSHGKSAENMELRHILWTCSLMGSLPCRVLISPTNTTGRPSGRSRAVRMSTCDYSWRYVVRFLITWTYFSCFSAFFVAVSLSGSSFRGQIQQDRPEASLHEPLQPTTAVSFETGNLRVVYWDFIWGFSVFFAFPGRADQQARPSGEDRRRRGHRHGRQAHPHHPQTPSVRPELHGERACSHFGRGRRDFDLRSAGHQGASWTEHSTPPRYTNQSINQSNYVQGSE